MSADGRYCMRVHHAKAALLLDLVDEAWAKDTLPDDLLMLPLEMQVDPETDEQKVPQEDEVWADLGLGEFTES